jgi:hypothetical protein
MATSPVSSTGCPPGCRSSALHEEQKWLQRDRRSCFWRNSGPVQEGDNGLLFSRRASSAIANWSRLRRCDAYSWAVALEQAPGAVNERTPITTVVSVRATCQRRRFPVGRLPGILKSAGVHADVVPLSLTRGG